MRHIIVSRHFLRRTARYRMKRLRAKNPTTIYEVTPSPRGPYRWLVVRY